MFGSVSIPNRRFQLILIKPSHYDDDGYVIQWLRSLIPSNSLAVLYGLATDATRRQVLGADVALDITPIDETHTRVNPKRIIARLKRHGGLGLVGLVGVQSNQFPRALDIARPLRAAGVPVIIGGFHVSGCLAMLSEMPSDLRAALDMGISLFAGEAEQRFDTVLRDAASGSLRPIYNFLNDLPAVESAPIPYLPRRHINRTAGKYSTFDAGRGCPYQCSFCTIINVQGRKSRGRSPDDVEQIIRQNWAEGIDRVFITDDNFARNKDWESILDRIIRLRIDERISLKLIIQVDTLSHKIPNFVEKCVMAGVVRVFIGLESINPDNLIAAKKRQNKITEYRNLLLAWKRSGVTVFVGYILGFPHDTPESIRRDIAIIQSELPIDIIEFFVLTPLPGSEDHQVLWRRGVPMDADMNRFDGEHVVTAHATMTREQWEEIYRVAWDVYYSPEHLERVIRRTAATGGELGSLTKWLLFLCGFYQAEGIHPYQGGILRVKHRRGRRPGLPKEPAWRFYPKYFFEMVRKLQMLARTGWRLYRLKRKIESAPDRLSYQDEALLWAANDELQSLQLFNQTEAARNAVRHVRAIERLTGRQRGTEAVEAG
ncbi:MAG: radical SAM protein [Proteobacteria bacterium]|nr:MAG: radical SAM protein [Pseudomonadota bacterium]